MALPKYQMNLSIEHVPTGFTVEFPAFLEMFSDAYTQQWNSEDVYGRMDPITTFVNTRRAVALAWNVPAESYLSAQQNLQKVNTLMSFLYPLYEDEGIGGATAINQAPLLRISFGNLIRNAQTGGGLLGYVQGFTFDPALEFGMFHSSGAGSIGAGAPDIEYYPKTFRLNCEFNVLHEHSPGFQRASANGQSFSYRAKGVDNSSYPYGSGLSPTINEVTDRSKSEKIPSSIPLIIPKSHAEREWRFPTQEEWDGAGPVIQPLPQGSPPLVPLTEADANPTSTQNSLSAAQVAMGKARPKVPTNDDNARSTFSAYKKAYGHGVRR